MKFLSLALLVIFISTKLSFAQQWKSIGPPGGRVTALSVSPSNPNTIFAATEENVLFISHDGGLTSDMVRDSIGFFYFGSSELFFNPRNADTVYTSNFISTDGGKTWRRMMLSGLSLAINPLNTKRIFMSSGKQLLVSNNAGETWTSLYTFKNSVTAIALAPTDTSILYASANDSVPSIYKSTNSGVSWVPTALQVDDFKRIIINPKDANVVYVLLIEDFYKTSDGGKTWTLIFSQMNSTPDRFNDIALNPIDTGIVYIATGDYFRGFVGHVHKSTNGGTTWSTVDAGLPKDLNRFIYHIEINPLSPDELFVGTYGFGVFKTSNGGMEWTWSNITKPSILDISIDEANAGHIYAGTYDEGLVKTTNGGASWSPVDFGVPQTVQTFFRQIRFHPTNNQIAYATGGPYGLLKSTNGGLSWQQTTLKGSFDTWAWSIAIHPTTPETLYVGQTGWLSRDLYRSINGGAAWENLQLIQSTASIEKILIDKRFPNIIYVCAADQGFFKSTDKGNTWQKLNNGLKVTDPPLVAPVMSLTIGESIDELYLAQRAVGINTGGVYKSTNGGNSWFAIDTILRLLDKNISAHDICVSSEYVFVSLKEQGQLRTPSYSSGGVYLGTKDGRKWKKIFNGSAENLKFDPLNHRSLYVGTKAGIFLTTDSIFLSVKNESEQYPSTVTLSQNYPNPFNSQTIIRYSIKNSGESKLTLFDILGRKIKEFFFVHQIGEHIVMWDGTNKEGGEVPSGVYFYSLESRNQAITKKLILLR